MDEAEIKAGLTAFLFREGVLPSLSRTESEDAPFALASIQFVSKASSLMRWEMNQRIFSLIEFVGLLARKLSPLMRPLQEAEFSSETLSDFFRNSVTEAVSESSLVKQSGYKEIELAAIQQLQSQSRGDTQKIVGHRTTILMEVCCAMTRAINDIDDSIL